MKFLDRLFRREEMDGDGRCPTYLVRWTLLSLWSGIGLYLHHFVGDDWSLDLHDHPKRFVSIGLKGRYREGTPTPETSDDIAALFTGVTWRTYRAPWVRTFPAEHIHRIELVDGRPCWTLVLVLRTSRPWGFWHQHVWIPWRQYVGSETATKMKSCP
jgi:hypothetical protein